MTNRPRLTTWVAIGSLLGLLGCDGPAAPAGGSDAGMERDGGGPGTTDRGVDAGLPAMDSGPEIEFGAPRDVTEATIAPADEPVPPPVPDTMVPSLHNEETGTVCRVAGLELPLYGATILDDCTICQCTRYGGRCSRRESCSRDVCVFVDGTEAPLGAVRRVHGCFVCTCDDAGGSCVRDAAAPCPGDGCLVPYLGDPRTVVMSFGQESVVSECHLCACDEAAGGQCYDWCHQGGCDMGNGERADDQARFPALSGCGSCVCDYGERHCDPRTCGAEL